MQSLELERNTEFDIAVPEINDAVAENTGSIQPVNTVFDNALRVKPVIKAQEYTVESAGKSLKIAQSGYLPTLNLNFGYGTDYFYLYFYFDRLEKKQLNIWHSV